MGEAASTKPTLELICTRACSKCRAAIALLDTRGVAYRLREYTEDPLDEAQLRQVLTMLGVGAADLLRTHDAANEPLKLRGDEDEGLLLKHMAAHPTLVQRPIAVLGARACIGRPPERILELLV